MLRRLFLALGVSLVVSSAATAAEVKVTGVHNCCPGCTDAIKKAVEAGGGTEIKLEGMNLSFQAAEPDKTVQALFRAGYAGKVEGARQPGPGRGARMAKGKSLKFEGVHNCCGQCTKAINEALKAIGKTDAKARETTFTVTSENEVAATDIIMALRAVGINARLVAPAQ